jgi:hypothetical protein
MGAYATIRLPVDLTQREAAASVAQRVVDEFPGTRNVTVDAAGAVTFDLLFPGNLSALASRLRSAYVPPGDSASVSIAFRQYAVEPVDPSVVLERVTEGVEVWDPEFPRGRYVTFARVRDGRVEASVEPSTNSMHELYDSLLSLGALVDEAPPAA